MSPRIAPTPPDGDMWGVGRTRFCFAAAITDAAPGGEVLVVETIEMFPVGEHSDREKTTVDLLWRYEDLDHHLRRMAEALDLYAEYEPQVLGEMTRILVEGP